MNDGRVTVRDAEKRMLLASFIVFGRPFIHLWAGTNYDDAYWITLLFFVPLTVPLIQNVGISFCSFRQSIP